MEISFTRSVPTSRTASRGEVHCAGPGALGSAPPTARHGRDSYGNNCFDSWHCAVLA